MKNLILTYFKGVAKGASDVIPGVSGGTNRFYHGNLRTTD